MGSGHRPRIPDRRESREDHRRGDSNADGAVELADAIVSLNWLFLGGQRPSCLDAADTDDSGEINLADPVGVLGWLFIGGPAPRRHGPFDCGEDPTEDSLGNCRQEACEA